MNRERLLSEQMYREACKFTPGGVHSPIRSFKGMGMTPLVASHGKEDLLIDVDGNTYIDFCCSFGALILGHAPARVLQGVIEQLSLGSTFGLNTPIELKLASLICEKMQSIEKVRFVSSGTESVMSAVRLARGFTKRKHILKFNGNYHGHSDGFLLSAGSELRKASSSPSSLGVTEESVQQTFSLPYNNSEACRELFNEELAAVVVEPIAGNMGTVPAHPSFLAFLREETKKCGALLIFDEVITGFRVEERGAQGLYGIMPDLTCLGKVIGGGFPAAAFGGRKEIMDFLAPLGPVFQAGTLSGNPIAMRAGVETLLELSKSESYPLLEAKTKSLTVPIQEAIVKKKLPHTLHQRGSMFSLFLNCPSVASQEDLASLDEELFKKFFHYLLAHGVYIPPSPYETWFVTLAHTEEHLAKTRDLILGFL